MRRALAVLLVATAFAAGAAACSGSSGYGPAVEATFVAGCNPDHDATREPVCRCAYERLSARLAYDDFRDLDKRLHDDPTKVPAEVVDSMTYCALAPRVPQTQPSSSSG